MPTPLVRTMTRGPESLADDGPAAPWSEGARSNTRQAAQHIADPCWDRCVQVFTLDHINIGCGGVQGDHIGRAGHNDFGDHLAVLRGASAA